MKLHFFKEIDVNSQGQQNVRGDKIYSNIGMCKGS